MPGVLFSTDCSGITEGNQIPGFVNAKGNGNMVQLNGVAGAVCPKPKGYGRNNLDDASYWNNNGNGELGNQVMRISVALPAADSFIGCEYPAVRMNADCSTFYRLVPSASGGKYGLRLDYYTGNTNTTIAAFTYPLPGTAGTYELEIGAKNGVIEGRMFKKSDPYPAPIASVAHDGAPTGFPGQINGSGVWSLSTDLVVTDGTVSSGVFDPVAAVALIVAAMTGGGTMSTGTVTYSPPTAGVTNLAGSNMSGSGSMASGAVTYAPPVVRLTTDAFTAYGSPDPLAGLTVPHTEVIALDGSAAFHIANAVTDGLGRLVLSGALTAGTKYAVANWDATGVNVGCKIYQAA